MSLAVNTGRTLIMITCPVVEVSCCRRLQRAERRHRADEPLSTFRSFVENEGPKETTWYVFLS